jgi:uncharacterized protein (TIGR03067 family)
MSDQSDLEGIWQPVYAELDGEEAPIEVLQQTVVEFSLGEYFVSFGGQISDQGSYVVEAAGLTLSGLDGPNAGRVIPCIFKFSGENLSICYGLGGGRPKKFTTSSGQQLYLVNYQRKPV